MKELKLPDDVIIEKIVFSQPIDNCQSSKDGDEQILEVEFHNGGGGYFYRLSSDAWAVDSDNDNLQKLLSYICKLNDESQS